MKRKQTTYDAGLAFRLREDKARSGDTFKAAYAAAEAAALDVAIRWSTADLQAAGGWTAVVTAAFDTVAPPPPAAPQLVGAILAPALQ